MDHLLTSSLVCFLSTASQTDLPFTPSIAAGLFHQFNMSKKTDSEFQAQSIQGTKKVLFGLVSIFIIVGIIRQWPILGKTYMEFIEGKGYLSLMLGLIMIVLGFSVPLLLEGEEDS